MEENICSNCVIGVYFTMTNLIDKEKHISNYLKKIDEDNWEYYMISIFQYFLNLNTREEVITCQDCEWNKSYELNRFRTKRIAELISFMELLDIITGDDVIEKTKIFLEKYDYFKNIINKKYNFCKQLLTEDIKFWKDIDFYYEYIFDIPKILYEAGVNKKIYNFRKNIYFDDVICGHPMASDGWCKEAMENLRELGTF